MVAASVLLCFGAAPALAWEARTIEGTEAERRNSTTSLPPGGDQCSLGAPDSVKDLYDFSWACYAHDLCYQNHQLNGQERSRSACDNILLAKAVAECDSRNPKRRACQVAARAYWAGVRAAGKPSWESWNGPPTLKGWERAAPKGSVRCSAPKTVSGAYNRGRGFTNGYASGRVCLMYSRDSRGTYSYQGALKVEYHQFLAPDVFAGKSMSVPKSTGKATGIRDCSRISWSDGNVRWCYSPIRRFRGRGVELYAKGYVIDYAGRWHPVWSPTITTY